MRQILLLFIALIGGVFSGMAQHDNFHLKIAMGIGADAEMFYGGPVIQIGTGYPLGQRGSLDVEYLGHFASKNAPSFDPSIRARWQQHTIALLPTLYMGRNRYKGFYMGAGPIFQVRNEKFKNNYENTNEEQNYVTLAMRFGTAIPTVNNGCWIFEAFFTGPLLSKFTNGNGIEIFTQLSFNVGYRFDLVAKHKQKAED